MSTTGERFDELDDEKLLENTNKLLAHVGISAKKIVSLDELIRVASSMFVAVFETIFRTRLEGIIRNPKNSQDYISNCQTIIDGLSQHLEMDLRHITGEFIFQGNRRALHNLVRIFMRITHMPSDDYDIHHDDRDSDSISSHESAFPPENEEIPGPPERHPLTDSTQSLLKEKGKTRKFQEIRMSPPWSPLSTGYNPSFSTVDHIEEIDELDIGNLRHSLSEYEQYKKVEAARKRRDIHLRMKTYQSLHRNQKNLEITCAALQKQWTEDVTREKYSAILRKSNADSVLLRKIQKGMLKQLYDSNEAYNQEIKSKIKEIRKDTKLHFESLQNLFDNRVRMMKERAKEVQNTSEQEVSSYKILAEDLTKAQKIRQHNISNAQRELIQQRRLHADKMRKDAHHQLLSFISMNETWEDSLRTNTLDVYPPSSSSSKRKEKRSHLSSSKHQQKSPYSTPVIRNPRGVRRSKSMSSLKF